MLCAAYITRVWRHDSRLKGEGVCKRKGGREKRAFSQVKNDVLYRHTYAGEVALEKKRSRETKSFFCRLCASTSKRLDSQVDWGGGGGYNRFIPSFCNAPRSKIYVCKVGRWKESRHSCFLFGEQNSTLLFAAGHSWASVLRKQVKRKIVYSRFWGLTSMPVLFSILTSSRHLFLQIMAYETE
jgi:hypothetical protein